MIISRFIYSPYGDVQVLTRLWETPTSGSTPAAPWSHLFQGLKVADVTGLASARHRDYSASLGRFIERDPIGFDAGDNNWYRFVGNGPTGKTDPSGLVSLAGGGWEPGVITVSGGSAIPTIVPANGVTFATPAPFPIPPNPAAPGNCHAGAMPKFFVPPTNPPQFPPTLDQLGLGPGWKIEIHAPDAVYRNGHWHLFKQQPDGRWQPVDPRTLKPGPPQDTHVPIPEPSPKCPSNAPHAPFSLPWWLWWLRLPVMIVPVRPEPGILPNGSPHEFA
jgi:RHS repeat-associated protein